jgi:calcineurin-like phosphoesterase family protein
LIYLIADTHFEHRNIIKYCSRPENHEEIQKEKILKTLKQEDILIHLGDVGWRKESIHHLWFKQLVCRKWLVKGNHDSHSVEWYLQYWDFACHWFEFKHEGQKIIFSHRPKDVPDDTINIHGHLHNIPCEYWIKDDHPAPTNKHILISPERLNYNPILLQAALKLPKTNCYYEGKNPYDNKIS